MYYLIKDTLTETTAQERKKAGCQYVAVITSAEWKKCRDEFEMGIDMDSEPGEIYSTKAEVNYDSLTGSFSIPDRSDFVNYRDFLFALDEKGIVFIDDTDTVIKLIEGIKKTKKWRFPSLERFLYDFLEQIVKDDRELPEKYEKEIEVIRDLKVHY